MERLPSGDFRLVECKEPLKTGLGVTVKQGPDRETLRCHLDFRIQTLSGRKPVPGVDLNVGMPEISTRTLATEIVVRKKEPCVGAMFQDKDGLLIVVMTVQVGDAGAKKSVGVEVPLDIKIQEAEPKGGDPKK